jgi:hypothetical protein
VNTEMTAAIYGAIAGGIVSLIVSVAAQLFSRWLRQRGGIECTPDNWRSAYVEWQGQGQSVTPSRVRWEMVSYQMRRPEEGLDKANLFVYEFTVELLNRMDVGAALRDISVDFKKNGATLFTHRPFDVDKSEDWSGIIPFEEAYRDVSADLGDKAKPPGDGIQPVGSIPLPSLIPVKVRLKGYTGDLVDSIGGLHHLRGGCDEARLRAIRENGEFCDWHITDLKTSPYQ